MAKKGGKTMTAKQKAIATAWIEIVGENNYPNIRHDDNGWSNWTCRIYFNRNKDELMDSKIIGSGNSGGDLRYRPKSLKGIEDNNGWIRIESKDDLPKDGLTHIFLTENGNEVQENTQYCVLGDLIGYTHWRPVPPPHLLPIY